MAESVRTFLHVSVQNLIKQLLLDSRRQVLDICKDKRARYDVIALIKSQPRCTVGPRSAAAVTHRGNVLLQFQSLADILSMAHCKTQAQYSMLCFPRALNCARTKPEHWWLFSGSIVNGTGFVWQREADTKGSTPCSWLGARFCLQRNTWHSTISKKKIKRISEARIIFYPCSTESEQKVVALKVHVSPANTLRHRDAMLHNKASRDSSNSTVRRGGGVLYF